MKFHMNSRINEFGFLCFLVGRVEDHKAPCFDSLFEKPYSRIQRSHISRLHGSTENPLHLDASQDCREAAIVLIL